jgi:hypothetical protein
MRIRDQPYSIPLNSLCPRAQISAKTFENRSSVDYLTLPTARADCFWGYGAVDSRHCHKIGEFQSSPSTLDRVLPGALCDARKTIGGKRAELVLLPLRPSSRS